MKAKPTSAARQAAIGRRTEPRHRSAIQTRPLTIKQIQTKAVAILDEGKDKYGLSVDTVHIDSALAWIKEATDRIARISSRFSKPHKRAIKQFSAALRKAVRDLPEDLWKTWGLDFLLYHCSACEQISLKPMPDAYEKELAAIAALHLCKQFGITPTGYRYGPFCRLAAVLHGDEDANLQHHCLAELKSKRKSQQPKVPLALRTKWQRAGTEIVAALRGTKPGQK
jgi:hypothetical protein